MSATLHALDEKLAHARELAAQFKSEAAELKRQYASAVQHVVSADGRQHSYILKGAPPVPAHWPRLVGDILHNCRSVLDPLARELVRLSGGAPTRASKFPLRKQKGEDHPDISPGVSTKFRQLLDEVQPYQFPGGFNPASVIQALNNLDKHEAPITPVVWAEHWSWSAPEGVTCSLSAHGTPLVEGDLVGRLRCEPGWMGNPLTEVRFGVGVPPDLGPTFIRRGELPSWALAIGVHYIGRVVDRFRPFLKEE